MHKGAQNVSAATTGTVLGLAGPRPPQSSFKKITCSDCLCGVCAAFRSARLAVRQRTLQHTYINTHVNYCTCCPTMPLAILRLLPIRTDCSTPTATHQPSDTTVGSNPPNMQSQGKNSERTSPSQCLPLAFADTLNPSLHWIPTNRSISLGMTPHHNRANPS